MPTEPQELKNSLLKEKLLSISFINKPEGIRFSKTELSKYPELLYEAVNKVNEELKVKSGRLIVLATSGIPFGTILSQSLQVPAHFYRRHGWTVTEGAKENIYNILPSLPAHSRVSLIDSHSRRRKTARTCYEIIKNTKRGIAVEEIITLFGLDHFGDSIQKLSFQEHSLISLSQYGGYLANLLSSRKPEEFLAEELKQDSMVWKEPWHPIKPSTTRNLAARTKNIFDNPSEYPLPAIVPSSLNTLSPNLSNFKDDKKVWNVFSYPHILNKIGQIISDYGILNDFDAIVGCQAIGSILSWILAYHANYKKPVLSCYDSTKLVPLPDNIIQDKKVLLIQGRIITGFDTEGVLNRIEKSGGRCKNVLSLFWMPEQKNSDRCAPLRRLNRYGVNFFTLIK